MTSRERVLMSLNHREPDQVPIDLSAHRSSGISALAYPKLRAALGLEPRSTDVFDAVQQLAFCHEDVLDRLGVDVVGLGRGFCKEDKWWTAWVQPDGAPCRMPVWAQPERDGTDWILRSPSGRKIARMPEGSMHFDQCYWPFLDGEEDLSRIEELFPEHMWPGIPSPPGPSVSAPEELAAGAAALRAGTSRAILGSFGGNLLEMGQFFYRMDNFLAMLAGEPSARTAFLDALVGDPSRKLEKFLGTVGPYIDSSSLATISARRTARRSRRNVSRVLQAAPRHDVAARQAVGQRESHAPLLRRRAPVAARPDRRRP